MLDLEKKTKILLRKKKAKDLCFPSCLPPVFIVYHLTSPWRIYLSSKHLLSSNYLLSTEQGLI